MQENSTCKIPIYIAYSAPHIASTWLVAPVGIIQGIYAMHYGVPLTVIAMVVFFAKFFDAITDPLIGYYNDRYFERRGTRKPFIFVGGLLCIVSGYFLYVPTDIATLKTTTQVSVTYFTFCFFIFFLSWTLFDIPHLAWANELAHTAREKDRLFSVRTAAYYIGILLFYSIPLLPIFETSEITPETLHVSVMVSSLFMLILLCCGLKFAPDSHNSLQAEQLNTKFQSSREKNLSLDTKHSDKKSNDYLIFLRSLSDNKPFLLFIAAFLCTGLGAGTFFGLFFIYVDSYLRAGQYFAQTTMLGLGAGILSIPVWYALMRVVGKKAAWLISTFLMILGFLYIATLHPGSLQFYELVIAITLLNSSIACMWIVSSAMLSEIVDYSSWKYCIEKTATYFSLYVFSGKFGSALATSLGLIVAGRYGLDVTAATHSDESVWGIRLVMTWIPLLFSAIAIIFIALSPITNRRHTIIRRRLDKISARKNLKKQPQRYCPANEVSTDVNSIYQAKH